MSDMIRGIHHVTAISSDAQRTVDFYAGVLGLRVVKQTVNYDDPGTYHLYFADAAGRPGTVMTFFPWPGAGQGVRGAGQVLTTSFAVPPGALPRWKARLAAHDVATSDAEVLGHSVLNFQDSDGLELALVEAPVPPGAMPWVTPETPAELAIHGFHGVALAVRGGERSASLLTDVLGFTAEGAEGERQRFVAPGDDGAATVDLLVRPDALRGRFEAGTVHHVAWRVADLAAQQRWRERIDGAGFNITPILDRSYFTSVYFREPGGVIFELATDGPGFATDESAESMGTRLVLPARLEPHRAALEAALPALVLPGLTTKGGNE